MSSIDWIVTLATLGIIIVYGIWKSRKTKTLETYLLADRSLPWYHVTLSVMATQASAITFLSAPGQAYTDGMRFIQFYFGLPLATIILCVAFVPIFHKMKVFTAYQYLEERFDGKTRTLTAFLFLLQRGLSTGITIYAPAIVMSQILHISINLTIVMNAILVILYTVYGGTKAVSYTQLLQMVVIFSGLFLAGYLVVHNLPNNIGLSEALDIAGIAGRTKVLDTQFDPANKFNLWSGLIGGLFLQLSYFGTDQSQVGRYLTGRSINESRLGLFVNGLVKIPMQFFILMLGALVFSFYHFTQPPVFFNEHALEIVKSGHLKTNAELIQTQFNEINALRLEHAKGYIEAQRSANSDVASVCKQLIQQDNQQIDTLRKQFVSLLKAEDPKADQNDSNFVFLYFVTHELPKGVIGLLIAVIFLAAMGSTASGLNSLASSTMVDFVQKYRPTNQSEVAKVNTTRWLTVAWGLFCMCVAFYASKVGNLIEAVNVLGSLFYGVILGIFLTAFVFKKIKGTGVFYAALISEVLVIGLWYFQVTAFLWLNLIGCVAVMLLALVFELTANQALQPSKPLD